MLNYYPYFWQSHSRKVKKTTEVRALNSTFCLRVYFDCQKLRVVTSFEVYPFIFNFAYLFNDYILLGEYLKIISISARIKYKCYKVSRFTAVQFVFTYYLKTGPVSFFFFPSLIQSSISANTIFPLFSMLFHTFRPSLYSIRLQSQKVSRTSLQSGLLPHSLTHSSLKQWPFQFQLLFVFFLDTLTLYSLDSRFPSSRSY